MRDEQRLSFYVSGDGKVGFVLDRTGQLPLMRMNGSSEVIVLHPYPATRGDIVMHNKAGDIVLRMTSYGPATYFPDGDKRGIPLLRSNHPKPIAVQRAVETGQPFEYSTAASDLR